jgi:hypothetical protein
MDIDSLKAELTADSLTRDYSGMDAAAVAADLNTVYRTRNRTTMNGSEILNATVKSEYVALSDAKKDRYWQLLHLGQINPFGIEAALLIDIFGGGSGTITALAAARKDNITRGDELGIGKVKVGHVQEARK